MISKIGLLSSFVCLLPSLGLASIVDSADAYYVDVHYSAIDSGQPVDSVVAHLGVEKIFPDQVRKEMIWESVKDVSLEKKGDAFVGSVSLYGTGYSGSLATKSTPVVQYFVRYVDGSIKISPVFKISPDEVDVFLVDYPSGAADFVRTGRQIFQDHTASPTDTRVARKSTRLVLRASKHGYNLNFDQILGLEADAGLGSLFK